MKIIKSLQEIEESVGITIGNFDGVHIGHQMMLEEISRKCKMSKLPLVVLTFVPHPVQILSPQNNFLLSTYKDRKAILEKCNVDYLLEIDFNRDLSTLDANDFIDQYILSSKNVSHFFIGHDFAFGAGKKGDSDFISEYCSSRGVVVEVMKQYDKGDKKVSSSIIRNFLDDGNVFDSAIFLGRSFSISGVVIKGQGRGKRIGIPTANISIPKTMKVPKSGVYITKVCLHGQMWHSVTNIGTNPTFNDNTHCLFIETHILDFNNDIYGENIEVSFIKRIRAEKKYSDVNSLVAQIKLDIIEAQSFFSDEN